MSDKHDPDSLLKKIIQLNEELTLENKVVTEENKQLKEIIQLKETEINHLKCSYQKSAYQKFRLTQRLDNLAKYQGQNPNLKETKVTHLDHQ
jgi:hypothetical protein